MTIEIGARRVLLDSVQSTNNYVAEAAEHGNLADGTVIMARDQTSGRGQRGNRWEMQAGKDLAMSVLLHPTSIQVENAFVLNKAVALSVRRAIAENVIGAVEIKWPNDILIDGLKVAGILIEMSWQGQQCQKAICGIGANVASDRIGLTVGAVSISESGGSITVEDLMDSLCRLLSYYLGEVKKGRSTEIASDYRQHLTWLGVEQYYSVDGQERRMTVVDVDDQGRLVLDENGERHAFAHGSIHRI